MVGGVVCSRLNFKLKIDWKGRGKRKASSERKVLKKREYRTETKRRILGHRLGKSKLGLYFNSNAGKDSFKRAYREKQQEESKEDWLAIRENHTAH